MAYPSEQQPFEAPATADWRQWFQLQGRPRPLRRSIVVAVAVAAAIAVLGVLLGLLWGWLAPTVPVVKLADGSIVVTDPSPEQYIAADGWFTLLGLGFGLIVTIGSWLALRRDRGPFLLLGIVGGTFVAGRWVAPVVGELLGRGAYLDWQAAAAQGATYLAPPEVQSLGPKLVPAFIAAIVLTLLAGWSNDPDLDHPGAHPGYRPNHGYPPYDQGPYGAPGGYPAPYPTSVDPVSPYAASPDPASPYAPPGPSGGAGSSGGAVASGGAGSSGGAVASGGAVPNGGAGTSGGAGTQGDAVTPGNNAAAPGGDAVVTGGNAVSPERPESAAAQPHAGSGQAHEEPWRPA